MQPVWVCLLALVSQVSAFKGNTLAGDADRGECFAPRDVGLCTGQEEAWYYNDVEGRCIFFVYSGCGGNSNRFPSRQQCEETCDEHYCPDLDCPPSCGTSVGLDGCDVCSCSREEAVAVCREPVKRGYCRALHYKWAWSQETRSCVSFIYGGCGGTENSFDSEEMCMHVCGGVARLA